MGRRHLGTTALALSAAGGLSLFFTPSAAEACGGLFCQPRQPVLQTGEQIVFSVDRGAGTVDAIINIRYSGPAEDFAWILPLQSAPTDVQVGPQSGFQVINQLTGPQFQLQFETDGRCRDANRGVSSEDAAFAGAAPPSERGGVTVVARKEVGPYDSVVLQGDDPAEVRRWLEDNGYAVTDEMMRSVIPYVQKGDVLLALKLRKNNDAGDIQPIHVTMQGDEVCVPIRLTAIAAVNDMDITVTVLSDDGRAVPENFFEVELNLAKIDWGQRGVNYREVVAEAADEGQGHAFTTEFAGSARVFDDQIFPPGGYDRGRVEAASRFQRMIQVLADQQLINKPGVGPILRRHVASPVYEALDEQAQSFDQCPQCGGWGDADIDASMVAAEIWDRVVLPERRLQSMMDGKAYATRLYTLLSPEEMDVDPEFVFRGDLSDVTNVHIATQVTECGFAGGVSRQYFRIEETGQEVDLDLPQATLDAMPASARVRQLAEGVEVQDNRPLIARLLGESSGCTCVARQSGAGLGGLALLALAGLAFFRRRR